MNAKSLVDNISDSNRACAELLITNANPAWALPDLAERTKDAQVRSRRIGDVNHAYRIILGFLTRLEPAMVQTEVLSKQIRR